MLTIESKLTRAGYIKLRLLMMTRRWSFYLVIGLVLLIYLLAFTAGSSLLFAVLYLVFVILIYSISIFYMAFSSKNRNFFLPAQYIFHDDNVSITSPISQETLKWNAFVAWKRMGGYYLIYVSAGNFLAIPKSAILAQDISTFESLLGKNIKKK